MENLEDILYPCFSDAADEARIMAKQLGIIVRVVRSGPFWMIQPDPHDLPSQRDRATQDRIDAFWQRREDEEKRLASPLHEDADDEDTSDLPEVSPLWDDDKFQPSDIHYDDHHDERDPARPARPIVNYIGREFDDGLADDA